MKRALTKPRFRVRPPDDAERAWEAQQLAKLPKGRCYGCGDAGCFKIRDWIGTRISCGPEGCVRRAPT